MCCSDTEYTHGLVHDYLMLGHHSVTFLNYFTHKTLFKGIAVVIPSKKIVCDRPGLFCPGACCV